LAHLRPNLQNAYVEPRNEIERAIANIWQELMGIDQVGIHDNFFNLGGHSLLGIQVISRLRNSLHVELSVRSLFEKPTIEELAGVITERAEPGDLAAILTEVESLSDEEAQQLLDEERS
jgi:acyl carrier protein